MGHSTKLVQTKPEMEMYFPKKYCMYANYIICKVHISSSCAVNSHIIFSESVGIFALSPNLSLLKHSNHNLIRRVILTF